MMSTIFFNKYALLLITLLFSESILAMDNVEFQKLVIKNIYKVIPADRDKFRLVRPESGAKKFPLIYSNDKDRVKTINCTQRVEFDLLALGNIMGTLKLAVCPYSILGRDKMTEMEVAFYKELEIITTYKKLDEKQLEEAGFVFTQKELNDGNALYVFPVILVGHGIIAVKTLILYSPDNSYVLVGQLYVDQLCGSIVNHALCDKQNKAIIEIMVNIMNDYLANKINITCGSS